MQVEELKAFERAARRFARERVAPMVGTEGRDGALESLPGLLDEAERAGFVASADPESPGFDYGVWGRAAFEEGPAASLALLRSLARACAGVAACVHVVGLGSAEQLGAPAPLSRATVAICDASWRFDWSALVEPPKHAVHWVGHNGAQVLRGSLTSVPRAPDSQGVVLFARGAHGWEVAALPWDAPGLHARPVGATCGLAALTLYDLRLDEVTVPYDGRLGARSPLAHLRRAMLGWSAIAVGNAESSHEAAVAYAADRYQGGGLIDAHHAVRGLLGDAASRIEMANAHVQAVSSEIESDAPSLRRAFATKLRVTEACRSAVSDCLQVLGGYGYMEDHRLEKRLRDAMTLETIGIRPADLRMLCGAPTAEVDA